MKDWEKRVISDLKFSLLFHFLGLITSCQGKDRYYSKKEALNNIGSGHPVAYKCLFCGFWHLSPRPHQDTYDAFESDYRPSSVYTGLFYLEGCDQKAAFRTRLNAMAHALLRRKQGVITGPLDVYPCRHCGKWHIGHSVERDSVPGIIAGGV